MKGIVMVVVAVALSAGPAKDAPVATVAPASMMVVERSQLNLKQDPAEALYRTGGEAMAKGDYARAAEVYASVVERYPSSKVAEGAAYYQAFALYRMGGDDKLRSARDILTNLRSRYPSLAKGEPAALRTRICGELARRGDEACAAEVSARAGAVERTGSAARAAASANANTAGCPAEDDENDERIAALNALLQMDAVRAMPVLTKVLERRDVCSAGLRRKAVFLV